MIFGAQFGAVMLGTPVRKTPFLRAVLYLKIILPPRQARDKHRKR
jgi:hypothetical protein